MTHLSDFSYLGRAVTEVYITVYLIYSIWNNDKFRCLQPKRIFAGELRSIITVLMFTMMTTQLTWDIVSVYIKYSEGFMVLPDGRIITKPFQYWSPEHQKPIQPIDYIQCVTFALHTGVFFLMQCFWNYLSNSVAKRTFMSSFEFKFYIVWGMASVAIFPILQWRFHDDPLLSEAVPQLFYGIEVLLVACLGVRSDLRFKRLIAYSRRNQDSSTASIVARLSYFKQMNLLLTVILFVYGTVFIILCGDGLTSTLVINSNKFACDLLIANVNMGTVFLWLLFISIFHPRRNYAQSNAQVTTKSESAAELSAMHDTESGRANGQMNSTSPAGPTSQSVGQRLSQRITNFMSNNSNNASSYDQTTQYNASTLYTGSTNGEKAQMEPNSVFMRPMSPVNVDYPPSSLTNDTVPLATSGAYQVRSMSVEDPYSNQSIQFSMMDPKQTAHQRFPSPTGDHYRNSPDIPLQPYRQPSSRGASPLSPRYDDYAYHDEEVHHTRDFPTHAYRDDTTSPTTEAAGAGREKAGTDWLWQSPGRKNA